MKTDDLIDRLAADLTPARGRTVPLRILGAGGVGAAVALAVLVPWLGLRPDLDEAVRGGTFWMKAGYAVVLAVAGFAALQRLARPVGSGRLGLAVALLGFVVIAAAGAGQLLAAAPDQRLAVWLGGSWSRCPVNILALSVPALAVTLAVVRGLAPTRLARAGAACGLFAGGLAAAVYGLHCPETASAFLATWYSLGVALCVAAGAALGPWALRWR